MGAIGLPDVDALSVAIHHYFVYGQYFRTIYPELCIQLDMIFESDKNFGQLALTNNL